MNTAYDKILVINLGGIGDLLLSSPAVRALKQTFVRSSITMLVTPEAAPLARDFPYVDRVNSFSRGAAAVFPNAAMMAGFWARHFDIAIVMHSLVSDREAHRAQRLVSFVRPRSSAGRNTRGRGSFFSVSIPEGPEDEKHETQYCLDLAAAVGARAVEKAADLFRDGPALQRTGILLAQQGMEDGTMLVGLHPGGRTTHRWPLHYFCAVIRGICERYPRTLFVVTGDASESKLGYTIMHNVSARVINFAGVLSLKETIAVVRRCSLYIANDSGPLHAAALAGVPVVALFGPGSIKRYDPSFHSAHAVTLCKDAGCSPCDVSDCPDMKCLCSIMPQEVIDASLRLLGPTALP